MRQEIKETIEEIGTSVASIQHDYNNVWIVELYEISKSQLDELSEHYDVGFIHPENSEKISIVLEV